MQEAYDAGIADASDYSSDAADPAPDVVDASASGEDFETDEDKEAQSDHEEEELRWSPPKNWDKISATDELLKQCGEAVWKVPADRESLKSEDIGLRAEPQFEATASRKFIDLLFDALPLIAFFKNILVAESIRYGRQELRATVESA